MKPVARHTAEQIRISLVPVLQRKVFPQTKLTITRYAGWDLRTTDGKVNSFGAILLRKQRRATRISTVRKKSLTPMQKRKPKVQPQHCEVFLL